MEDTCRICRGDGTPSDPLLYPCKCRGSIRYIHQDCLMEWITHSNRSSKCDICNTEYKFTTVYDENTPQKVPFNMIVAKIVRFVAERIHNGLSVSLYILCVLFMVPVYWKFIGRVYTWFVDNNIPSDKSYYLALLYGESDLSTLENSSPVYWAMKFFNYTYLSGFRYVVVFIISHISLISLREWVVRDEGFTKLLYKKIGKEPKSQLVDLLARNIENLQQQQHQQGPDVPDNVGNDLENFQNLNNMVRILQDIRDGNNRDEDLNEELRLFLNRPNQNNNRGGFGDDEWSDIEDEDDQHHNHHEQLVEDDSDDDELNFNNEIIDELHDFDDQPRRLPRPFRMNDDPFMGENEQDQREIPEVPIPARPLPPRLPQNNNINNNNNNNDENEPNPEDDGILGLLGIKFDLLSPIKLSLLINIVFTVYLFIIYLIPSMMSRFMIQILALLYKIGYFAANLVAPESWRKFETISHTKFFSGILETINNLYTIKSPPTTMERFLLLSIAYGLIGIIIKLLMGILSYNHGLQNPLLGYSRTYYTKFHELTYILKVFLIFSVELIFFPIYCGVLVDFCISPLLSPITMNVFGGSPESVQHVIESFVVKGVTFTSTVTDTFTKFSTITLLFSSNVDFLEIDYIRTIYFWGIGTGYMCLFALFVGMLRSAILRPGVLFFIRSPDDPNTRLIHDALVRPLGLQLSRIALSGFFYTIFILVGIGSLSWGARSMLPAESTILPLKFTDMFQMPPLTLIIALVSCRVIFAHAKLIKKYVRLYWKRAFRISCHKLRLSSFILNLAEPKERGYIYYRNVYHMMMGTEPDYTNPTTLQSARQDESKPGSSFVPDGNYIRVPDNDSISRRYLKKLFVAVTKDDKLLNEIRTRKSESAKSGQESDSEDDIVVNNSYTIVYRPPYFGTRISGLLAMVWIFAALLLVGISMIAMSIGDVVVGLAGMITGKVMSRDSLFHIFVGLPVVLNGLKWYDRMEIEHTQDNNRADNGDEANNLAEYATLFRYSLIFTVSSLSLGLELLNGVVTHFVVVENPYKVYKYNDTMEITPFYLVDIANFQLTNATTLFHLLLLIVTIPSIVQKLHDFVITTKNMFRNNNDIEEMALLVGAFNGQFVPIALKMVGNFIILVSLSFLDLSYAHRLYLSSFTIILSLIVFHFNQINIYLMELNETIKIENYSIGKKLQNFEE